jgi:predicted dehydrogenase
VAVETDDFGSVVLRFESGARGTFAVSQVSAGRKNHLWFQVDTAEAALAWDQEEPNRLWIGRRDQPNEDLVRDPGLLDDGPGRLVHFPGGHQEGWPDALRNLFEDFYGAVDAHRRGEERTRTFASFEEAAHVARVVEAIAASDETRAWQRVRPAAQDQTTAMTEEGVR